MTDESKQAAEQSNDDDIGLAFFHPDEWKIKQLEAANTNLQQRLNAAIELGAIAEYGRLEAVARLARLGVPHGDSAL